jgi:orotate phosphoribosyltransferase
VKVLWLSGDIHSPSFVQKDNNLYIVSGRFGTSDELFNKNAKDLITVEKISYINRQGTLIQINSDHTANIQIINQVQKTAGYDSNYIQWRATEIDEFSLLQNQPELISEKLDKILYGAILQKKLFDYEKIVVDNFNYQVSLGWVMIDRLFSDKTNFNVACNDIAAWLQSNIAAVKSSVSTVLVGLDFGGAIVASDLSIRLGIENICLPSKGPVASWTNKEHIDGATEKFGQYLKHKSEIIIIADVVATGRSLRTMIDKLKAIGNPDASFYCVALICDVRQEKKRKFNPVINSVWHLLWKFSPPGFFPKISCPL